MGWWRSTDAQKKEGKTLKLSLSLSVFYTKGFKRKEVLALFWLAEGLPFPKKY